MSIVIFFITAFKVTRTAFKNQWVFWGKTCQHMSIYICLHKKPLNTLRIKI
jgi:hypothetical protein